MYFNIPSCAQCTESVKIPSNCYVACGPYFELDYDESIRHAKHIFKRIYENDEFLPRAPDPEEIIIEGDNPTDPLPSVLAELNLNLTDTQNESINSEQTTTIETNVQNELPENTQ